MTDIERALKLLEIYIGTFRSEVSREEIIIHQNYLSNAHVEFNLVKEYIERMRSEKNGDRGGER